MDIIVQQEQKKSGIEFLDLPEEILEHIISFLSLNNRGILCQVSQSLDLHSGGGEP